jgi:hypothetical protein
MQFSHCWCCLSVIVSLWLYCSCLVLFQIRRFAVV